MAVIGAIQVKIQKGTTTVSTANTAVNVAIEDVTNINRCVVLVQCRNSGFTTGLLTTTKNLSINSATAGAICEWTVIEYGGASV